MKTAVIIPALNEERSIGLVLEHIPEPYKQRVFVVDNGSDDRTAEIARRHGASVLTCAERGYGAACLAGVAAAAQTRPDVLVFLDADYSDYPEDMSAILTAMTEHDWDLVIGSRVARAEPGALLPQARFGNWLATSLLWLRFGFRFTDLGPFRAIRMPAYRALQMQDRNFGWTMEMQIKALRAGLRVGEVPVRYRERVGVSKITGTLKGTVLAGYKILYTLARYSFAKPSPVQGPEQQKVKCDVLH